MNKAFIEQLGKQAGLFVKQARANFLAKLFKPNIIGKELPVLRKQIGGYLQTGNTAGLAKHLGTDASNIEQQLQRRAQGLYNWNSAPVKPEVNQYLNNLSDIQAQRGGMKMFGNAGHYSQAIADARANMANLGQQTAREAAGVTTSNRLNNLQRLQADRTAMSGRHGTPAMLEPNLNAKFAPNMLDSPPVVFPGPVQAYKGFGSESALMPKLPGTAGDPAWWSGYSGVAHGYGSTAARQNPFSYVMQSSTKELMKHGPHSPNFHPHLATDTRHVPWYDLSRITQFAGHNPTWSSLPHYEGVFTHPGNINRNYFSNLYKALPSMGGFQRVGSNLKSTF